MKTLLSLPLIMFIAGVAQAATYTPIVRSFHSVRTAGMGDVRYTTGLYEENFYANPARVTQNPDSRFQLPKISLEASSNTVSALSNLLKPGAGLAAAADSVGKPLGARFQLVLPAYFSKEFTNDMWALGVGFMLSAQTSAVVSQTGTIDPLTLVNFGPAFTIGRRLLEEHRLSVGATLHTEFRGSSNAVLSIQDFLRGTDLSKAVKGGSGMNIDFDVGTSYRPHWALGGFEYEVGFAINNILNGMYKNGGKISGWNGDPTPSNRSWNFGISANHKDYWVFDNVLFALEFTDIGNNPGASIYRTVHIGTEARWSKLAARFGINQGYFTAGFGMDFHWFDLNVATYGEEMGLNAGTLEDRRYALEFGFQI
ncbi:MAG: hypothetical protein JST80_04315 [Bdellovibrionales bacterium]|nr:hypothetical protein [Bdellovibrionales bacterium]